MHNMPTAGQCHFSRSTFSWNAGGISRKLRRRARSRPSPSQQARSRWCCYRCVWFRRQIPIGDWLGGRLLQTTLMISLFLGELFRFSALRRFALLFAGLAIAYLCNLGRTSWLVWISSREGLKAIERWHDTAGMLVLVMSLVLLWIVA